MATVAGCEFVCLNTKCEYFNTGFVMTGFWPMAKIGKVISKYLYIDKDKNESIIEGLKTLKNQGKKYACITLPNDFGIEVDAYRVQFWSPEGKTIWEFAVPLFNDDLAESINKFYFPDKCTKTGGRLMSFEECLSEKIRCPKCGEELSQRRWFAEI